MEEFAFIAALAPVLVVGVLQFRRVGPSSAGMFWTFGWASLWANGLVSSLADPAEPLTALSRVLGGLFAASMLLGSARFVGRERGWALPGVGVGLGIASAALHLAGLQDAGFYLSRLDAGLFVVAAALLLGPNPRAVPSQRVLAVLFLAVGGLHFFSGLLPGLGVEGLAELAAWAGLSLGVAVSQIFCFMDRVRLGEARAVQRLEDERSTLRALFEQMPAGLLLVDRDDRIVLHNGEAAEVGGQPADANLTGLDLEAFSQAAAQQLPEGERAGALAAARRLDGSPGPLREFEARIEGPPERWIATSVREVATAAAGPLGRLWIFRDQTEAKQLGERLARATRMEALGKAIGGIAHDFNNQLTTVLGNTALLLEGLERDDSRLEPLRDIERAVHHSAEITRGLLDFARQRTGPLRPLDLERELDEVSAIAARLPAGVRFETRFAPDLPSLLADPTQLRRVLSNLVGNAADAVDGQGSIVVEAEAGPDRRSVLLRVRDDGEGMDSKTREHVFDPFFTTKGSAGVGLGMAIVHGIASAHGASIEVESSPAQGTCVTLRWPATEDAPAEDPELPPQATSLPGRGRVVLFTEDNHAVRKLGRLILSQSGFRVLDTEDGESALERVRNGEHTLDFAVLDFDLPGMDGLATLRGLREIQPELPALIASGRLRDEHKAGLPPNVAVLLKPYRPTDLVRAVSEAMDGHSEDSLPVPGSGGKASASSLTRLGSAS